MFYNLVSKLWYITTLNTDVFLKLDTEQMKLLYFL